MCVPNTRFLHEKGRSKNTNLVSDIHKGIDEKLTEASSLIASEVDFWPSVTVYSYIIMACHYISVEIHVCSLEVITLLTAAVCLTYNDIHFKLS
jgi:hypothetical protein